MIHLDKQNFVNACNNENGVDFIRSAALYLDIVSTKEELNDFVNIFGKISKIKTLVSSAELTKLCLTLRDKVYDILIANGDVPENNYIYLYNYYSLCELDLDPRYEAYEQFVDQNMYGADISDMERMFLIVLRFFAAMANSKKDAFEKFLFSVMRLNLIEVGSVSFSELVSHFIDDSNVAFEEVLGVVEKLLDKEFYFSLDKTQRRSIFNWSLHSLWLVERYFNHPSWVSLYPKWKEIFYEHIARNECDEAMYVQFFIYHKMGNSFQTQEEWKMFNEEIDIPASEYYRKWQEVAGLPRCKSKQNNGKKIIGFLQDRLAMNSPFKVQYSLWKALYANEEFRSKYEIKIYLMSYFEKSLNDGECLNMVENLGIEVFDGAVPFYDAGIYHSHLEKALYIREKMLSDSVDIVISPNNGYDISDFLLAGRVSPKQIFWSHGNMTYDIDNIDERITHCSTAGSEFEFKEFAVPMDVETFYNPYRDPRLIEQERAKYPKDAFILGVIGRLVKVDSDEYLQTIAEIMRQNPNTIFIAAGGGNVESIKSKVEKLGIADRFYTPGYVDSHIYGNIIDLWMDTFPLAQGESVYEFLAKNKPIIVLSKNGERGSCDEAHIVPTVEQYIEVANSIISNKDFRETIVSRLKQIQSDMFERSIADFVNKFYAFIRPINLPSRIALELTPKCNLSCGPCPRHYINEHDGFMDEELFKKLVDEIKTSNGEAVLLPFWRGESCLHPKFDELIRYALNNKIRMHISTNGHFMEDWHMDIFYRLEFVSISLHTDIGYKNAIKLVSSRPEWSKTKFQISFIDSEKSVEKYLHEIINSENLKGFDSVRLYKEHTIDGSFGKTNCLNELGVRQFCPKLTNTLVISWDGYYSRCSHIWNAEKDLNLKNTTIENVWHGSRMEEIRNNYPDNLCLPCDQWSGRTSGEEWNMLDNKIIHTKHGF